MPSITNMIGGRKAKTFVLNKLTEWSRWKGAGTVEREYKSSTPKQRARKDCMKGRIYRKREKSYQSCVPKNLNHFSKERNRVRMMLSLISTCNINLRHWINSTLLDSEYWRHFFIFSSYSLVKKERLRDRRQICLLLCKYECCAGVMNFFWSFNKWQVSKLNVVSWNWMAVLISMIYSWTLK